MRVAVTGSDGFLGRHLRIAMRARRRHEVVAIGRAAFNDEERLSEALRTVNTVIHAAGVNRDTPEAVEQGNIWLAQRLAHAIERLGRPVRIVYANSMQSGDDTPYGRGKQRAADILRACAERTGGTCVDVRLCNLFGEDGRPHYNSVVATFCDELANGREPQVIEDRTIQLLHAQEAATLLVGRAEDSGASEVVDSAGRSSRVGELLERLRSIAAVYGTGRIPDLRDRFDLELFNSYRSYLYPAWYPRPLRSNRDARGNFVEVVQTLPGESQTSFSTTVPGVTRGEHYHLRKIERFAVVSGQAEIAIRPVLGTTVSTFRVDGAEPSFVDMPTLYTHNITNTGSGALYTIFWINEIFDPADADTYHDPVLL